MEKVTPPTMTIKPQAKIPVEPILTPPLRKFPVSKSAAMLPVVLFAVAIISGIGTGWLVSKKVGANGTTGSNNAGAGVTTKNSVASETEAGIDDAEAFPDTAEGILVEGGISGEGTHHLDRGMGPAKDVYLSSTVINLQNFVGKKVEVRGQTISGKKAGWLMDVGKIKVIQ